MNTNSWDSSTKEATDKLLLLLLLLLLLYIALSLVVAQSER